LLSSKLKWYNCETLFVPTEELVNGDVGCLLGGRVGREVWGCFT